MRKKVIGDCRICGFHGPLTFEHVPPEKAFNNRTVLEVELYHVIGAKPGERLKGRPQQRGMGEHTLCAPCNNNTGNWYRAALLIGATRPS